MVRMTGELMGMKEKDGGDDRRISGDDRERWRGWQKTLFFKKFFQLELKKLNLKLPKKRPRLGLPE